MMRSVCAAGVAVIVLSLSPSVLAQQLPVHFVQPGETLASIAQRYYGDPRREVVLAQENALGANEATLVPGTPLVVPTVFFYRVATGETWKAIAQRLYGAENRAFVLVQANGGKLRQDPEEGAELLIPYPVRHFVAGSESVADVAKRYLPDDKDAARLIRRFNGLKGMRLERGQLVLVPARGLSLSAEGDALLQAAIARTGQGEARSVQAEATAKVPILIDHVTKGAYAEAVALGNQLLGRGQLTTAQEVTIQRELAAAYVALDRRDLAVAAFKAALKRQPNLELDTVTTSPKVLDALQEAKVTQNPE